MGDCYLIVFGGKIRRGGRKLLEEICDLTCNEVKLHEISNLIPRLNGLWNKAFEALGGNRNNAIIWGRAYNVT
jgi:hypothetical protein